VKVPGSRERFAVGGRVGVLVVDLDANCRCGPELCREDVVDALDAEAVEVGAIDGAVLAGAVLGGATIVVSTVIAVRSAPSPEHDVSDASIMSPAHASAARIGVRPRRRIPIRQPSHGGTRSPQKPPSRRAVNISIGDAGLLSARPE
jgi:hypothetical protein